MSVSIWINITLITYTLKLNTMHLLGEVYQLHITSPFHGDEDRSVLLGLNMMEGEYGCGCPLLAIQIGLFFITITITIGNDHKHNAAT